MISAERRLAAADKRISEANLAFMPTISLTGSAGSASNELSDMLDNDFSIWTFAGQLLQPIFQAADSPPTSTSVFAFWNDS